MTLRINVGCGRRPTPGWLNFDNATLVLFSRPPLYEFARHFLGGKWRAYLDVLRQHDVRFVGSTLPFSDCVVDVVYTSHMLEHLDRPAAVAFLREARRVLKSDGVLRVSVPDLAAMVRAYAADGDADRLIERTLLAYQGPQGFAARARRFIRGFREHRWMYDGASLTRLLREAGFRDVRLVNAGESTISDAGALDLWERAQGSVYAEARPRAAEPIVVRLHASR